MMIVPNYLSIAFNSAFNEVGGYEQLVDKYFLAVAENRFEQNQINHLQSTINELRAKNTETEKLVKQTEKKSTQNII